LHPCSELGDITFEFNFGLDCGIKTHCKANGIICFDFFEFSPATQIFIPGFSYQEGGKSSTKPTKEHERAVKRMLEIDQYRLKILNVHQLLLNRALACIDNAEFDWPVELSLTDVMHGTECNALQYRVLPPRGRYHVQRSLEELIPRRTVGTQALTYSFRELNDVIQADDGALSLLEEILFALGHQISGRNGSALVSIWVAIEQLLAQTWDSLVLNSGVKGERRNKLKSRDYTSSVRIEILMMIGAINSATYENLEKARRARNDWAHKFLVPSLGDLAAAKSAFSALFNSQFNVAVTLPYGGGGGYGMYWAYKDKRAADRFRNQK
jgi:hypothetical protein